MPESLSRAGLQPVWAAARQQLDRHGPDRRGSVTQPDLDSTSALALESLLGRRLTRRLDLGRLEEALVARAIGHDLEDAITRLGHPPSREASQRRVVRVRSEAAKAALSAAVASWDEPWAAQWAKGVVGAGLLGGLDSDDVDGLAADVRRLLDSVGRLGPDGASRTELAASLFGSAHALDTGTRLASFVSRALRLRLGEDLAGRELWEAVSIHPDRVSAPALVWAVPAAGDSPLDRLLRTAAQGALPVHVSLLAMQRHPVTVPAGTPVLVVENPRLAEAAAERRLPGCVVAANGNPSTAVTTLLEQMQQSGALIRYHGDFDAAGIAICRRIHEMGCTPWLMGAGHYEAALGLADRNDVQLERDARGCGPTPWDTALQTAFERHRLMVHEEFVLDRVLDEFARQARAQPGDVSRPQSSHDAGPSSNPETVPA